MKKKKLILHIGSYKTGSTSIQYSLYKNKDLLLELGFNYISVPGCIQKVNGRQTIFSESKDYIKKVLSESSGHTHILSNEGLWDRKLLKTKIISTIIELDLYESVEVIAYIRSQDVFFDSFYKQENKIGALRTAGLTPDQFFEELLLIGTLDYWNIIDEYCALFGDDNIKLCLFENRFFLDGDVLNDFLKITNLPVPDDFENYRMNESISNEYGLISSELNRTLKESLNLINIDLDAVEISSRNKIRMMARDAVDRILNSGEFTNVNLISEKLSHKILDTFYESNMRLIEKFNLRKDSRFFERCIKSRICGQK